MTGLMVLLAKVVGARTPVGAMTVPFATGEERTA